jgi:hypothetical protein
MADNNTDLLIDPLKKLGTAFSNATQGFMKASSPLYAARATLQSYNASLKSAKDQFDSQQVELARQRDAELSMLKEGSAEHSAVLSDYTSKLESLTDTFEEKEKVLKKSVENQEKIVEKEKDINRQSFGVARGFERVSQGMNSIQEGIKGLTFGLVDLTAGTGKLGEFFGGLQSTLTGIISVGAGVAEMFTGLLNYGAILPRNIGNFNKKIKEGLTSFSDGFVNLFRDRSAEFDQGLSAGIKNFKQFPDRISGLFGKKKVDAQGKVRDNKGKFAKGDADGVSAGTELKDKLVAFKDGIGESLSPKRFKTGIGKISKNFMGGIKGAFSSFGKAFKTLAMAGKAFLVGAGAFLKSALVFAGTALISLGSMILGMMPFILIGVAVVALAVLAYKALKVFDEKFPWFFDSIQWFFGKIYEYGKVVIGAIWGGIKSAFKSITDLFKFDEDTSLFGRLIDIVMLPVNMAINFIKGIFGWGDPDEPFRMSEFIFGLFDTVVGWFKGIFAWGKSEGDDGEGGWSLLKFIDGVYSSVIEWIAGIFGFQLSEDGESFSLFGFINEQVGKVWDWIKETFSWGNVKDTVGGWLGFGGDDEVDGERAMGGPVAKGNSYLVGEKGPEIFTPSQSGNIIPNDEVRTAAMLKQGQDDVDSARQTAMNAVMSTSMVTQQNVSNSQTQISSKISTRNSDPSIGRTAALAT